MRPTRTFSTSGGHELVLNEYITGAENWEIRQIYIRGLRSTDGSEIKTEYEAEKKAFEIVVVSFDGVKDDVAERVMALPVAEYREVTDEITPIVEGKKKSLTS